MSSPQIYRSAQVLGTGAFSIVFQAEEASTGRQVALKKSRVSQNVKRPILKYESRVLQLIQGHPAVPAIYGYGQLPHFEYMALELLGSSVKNCAKVPVSVTTAVRVVLQMLSALEHLHNHGFVHRDIKPENLLCSSTDPSKIVLIDFGISIPIKPGPPFRYNPLSESKNIVGTLHWASLNAHKGIGLAPRDDLESLAYVAFFLLCGDLPWRIPASRNESSKTRMRRVHALKAALSGAKLGAGFPDEFGYLLDYSRSLGYDQIPDYADLKTRFTELNRRTGSKDSEGPLDWSVVSISTPEKYEVSGVALGEDPSEGDDVLQNDASDEEEKFTNSYFNYDIGDWNIQGARDRSLTLPIEQAELLADSGDIPRIVEVTDVYQAPETSGL